MPSPFLGFLRRYRISVAAGSLGISVAILAAVFGLSSFKTGLEKASSRVPPAAPTSPAAPPVLNEALEEQPPQPAAIEPGADTPPPVSASATVLDDTASHPLASSAPTPEPNMDAVNQYLWSVYERSPIKRDGSGDFTWKDVAAAARLGMSLGDYVIRGMDADFRDLLYRAGVAMDAAGVRWTILSGFRDDYRQALASGYKARIDNSLHGGSAATGGYGHGCAVDIADPDHKSDTLWKWLDANETQVVGLDLGLQRPFPGYDPAHVLPRGAWHELAEAVRRDRLAEPAENPEGAAVTDLAAVLSAAPSEADANCINTHRGRGETVQANATKPAGRPGFKLAAVAHGPEKPPPRPKAAARSVARHAVHAPPRDAGTS
jgi:hypothetical protein